MALIKGFRWETMRTAEVMAQKAMRRKKPDSNVTGYYIFSM